MHPTNRSDSIKRFACAGRLARQRGIDMKIIVAGDGQVGRAVTRQLSREGYDLTVIDPNPEVLAASETRYDVMIVQGNAATMGTLRTAGVESADLLIAAISDGDRLLHHFLKYVLTEHTACYCRNDYQ